MVSYQYYTDTYLGYHIPGRVFPRYARQARDFLDRLCSLCRVVGGEDARSMAMCAMADTIYRYEHCAGVEENATGEVRVKYFKARSLNAQLYAQAAIYLEIYRGVS